MPYQQAARNDGGPAEAAAEAEEAKAAEAAPTLAAAIDMKALAAAPSSPSPSWQHVGLLWGACVLTVGAYYSKDVLAAVSPELMEDFHMSRQAYGAIYGLPAIPNIFASLLGGALVDGIGSDRSALLLALVVVLSSLLTSLSAPLALPALLAAGQLVMGVGKGSLITAQKVYLKGAASPDEVSLWFALSFSTSHAGTFLAFLLSPLVTAASPTGYEAALWTSTAVCVASAICALPLLGTLPAPTRHHVVVDDHPEDGEAAAGGVSWRQRLWDYAYGLATMGFLLNLVSIVCYYCSFFPFLAFSVHFLVASRGLPKKSASLYASLLSLGSVFLGPYFGHRVDVELGKPARGWHGWWGRRQQQGGPTTAATAAQDGGGNGSSRFWRWLALPGSVQVWAMLVTVLGLALVSALPGAWVVGFVAMGLGFAMASAALWPMVPVFVEGRSLGLAFGVAHAVMDIVLLVVDIFVGRLLDAGKSYPGTVVPLLLGIALVALVASALQMRLLLLRGRQRGEGEGAELGEGRQHQGPSALYPALLPGTRESNRGDVESG